MKQSIALPHDWVPCDDDLYVPDVDYCNNGKLVGLNTHTGRFNLTIHL